MEITVYGWHRRAMGVIDSAISVVWTERYAEPGEFELVVPATSEMLALLQLDEYVSYDKSDHWMVIETIVLKTDEEEGDTLVVSGRSLLSLYDRRQGRDNYAWGSGGMSSGDRADFVTSVLHDQAFGDWDSNKQVAFMTHAYSTDTRITTDLLISLSPEYRTGHSHKNILDEIISVNRIFGVGFSMTVLEDQNIQLQVYLGQDRTSGQTDNPVVIISPEFGNLSSSETVISKRTHKTFAYIWGAPEPPPPYKTTAGYDIFINGLLRRDMYVDGSMISPYSSGTTLKSTSLYSDELTQFGEIKLADYELYYNFVGKAEQVTFLYGEHYFLGDVVEFDNGYGQGGYALITEAVHTEDDTGYTVYPTFEFVE